MTREEYTQEILELSDSHKALMLHLPTGFGKSKIAIDIIKRHLEDKIMECNVLIVVPKLVRHAFNGNVDELRGVRDDAIALLQRINWR